LIESKLDCVLLVGGLGTRMNSILGDTPKCLAPINKDQLFIDLILNSLLVKNKFKRIILCVGHLKEKIIKYVNHNYKNYDIEFIFSKEEKALGTAGAVRNALKFVESNTFFVFNGDSFCDINFSDFYNSHLNKKSEATIGIIPQKKTEEYGSVNFNKETMEILEFNEKVKSGYPYINAGIYCMNKEVAYTIHGKKKSSLEYDFFPRLSSAKKLFAYIITNQLIDIGTPKKYMSLKKNQKI